MSDSVVETLVKGMSTLELTERLKRHYVGDPAKPEWNGGIFIAEVGINGYGQQRRCDAIYAGFTSASGRLLVGHEVKVSRSDWLAELKKVGKADFWHDNCHQWWLVVADQSIVHDGELPEGWGLMVPGGNGKGIKKITAARTRADVEPSWTAMRSILSRFDTERVALIAAARHALDRRHQDNLQSLRLEMAGTDGSHRESPDYQRLVALLSRVRSTMRAQGMYGEPTDDDIVATMVDLAEARSVLGDLDRQIESTVRQLEWAMPRITAVKDRIAAHHKAGDVPHE